jgi:hypothetical protein
MLYGNKKTPQHNHKSTCSKKNYLQADLAEALGDLIFQLKNKTAYDGNRTTRHKAKTLRFLVYTKHVHAVMKFDELV